MNPRIFLRQIYIKIDIIDKTRRAERLLGIEKMAVFFSKLFALVEKKYSALPLINKVAEFLTPLIETT